MQLVTTPCGNQNAMAATAAATTGTTLTHGAEHWDNLDWAVNTGKFYH